MASSSNLSDVFGAFVPNLEQSAGSISAMISDIPQEMSVFDIFFDVQTNSWQNWKSVFMFSQDVKKKTRDLSREALSLIVKTQDFCRMEFLMQRMLHAKLPILFIGPTSSGKTTLLRHYLRTQDNENKLTHVDLISCSIASTAGRTQQYIEQKLV